MLFSVRRMYGKPPTNERVPKGPVGSPTQSTQPATSYFYSV